MSRGKTVRRVGRDRQGVGHGGAVVALEAQRGVGGTAFGLSSASRVSKKVPVDPSAR